jgi:hypothetical protein
MKENLPFFVPMVFRGPGPCIFAKSYEICENQNLENYELGTLPTYCYLPKVLQTPF